MWNELTNIPIEQIVTIVACENGETQTIIEKPEFFLKKLEWHIDDFQRLQESKITTK